jgi:heparan-alpha-glucosaminide N-acetyltransferase
MTTFKDVGDYKLIILVAAGGYWFLEHATWNGLNVADLVFPW